jgi:hypothetical protein
MQYFITITITQGEEDVQLKKNHNLMYGIFCYHHTRGRVQSIYFLYHLEPLALILMNTMQIFCMHSLHLFPDFLLLVWRTQLCFFRLHKHHNCSVFLVSFY